ncbi:hypothetical protein V5E97_10450 [Singulisphaera sp. Ch08]|uniref:Uncharacterized protein n=1 Tax=Singulisphaera sp. Ch08 TaxID=3120278 RepID=A0AAU7CMR3_9BACT
MSRPGRRLQEGVLERLTPGGVNHSMPGRRVSLHLPPTKSDGIRVLQGV